MKILRPFLTVISVLLWILPGETIAQQNLFYSHYFLNPFLYNPSYVAPNGYSELFLNYRKQWSGIEGAPSTGTVSLHLPLNYKMGLAVSGFQDEAGVLKTTTGFVTFAYHVYLGQTVADHKLSFGISAGMTSSSIDPDKVDDPNDPVVGTTSSFDGQFGAHYQRGDFKLSFAIPRLFEGNVASEETMNDPGIEQIKATISSISYNFHFGERLSFEPIASYRTYEDTDGQFEGLGVFRIDNIGWLGGSYRQDYGATAFAGVNFKDKFKLGYAYEFATDQVNAFGDGTHELQLVVRLGKKKFTRPEATAKATETTPEPVAEQQQQEEPKEDLPVEEPAVEDAVAVTPPPTDQQPSSVQPQAQPEAEIPAERPSDLNVMDSKAKDPVKSLNGNGLAPGHYVVVGAFNSVANAKNYARTLQRAGYPADVAFHPERNHYIVHMLNAPTVEEARQQRDKYRQMSRYSFRDTWILTIE